MCNIVLRAIIIPSSSLLAIRHTQKQWRNFLLSALQGAKTVPPYLLSQRRGPWAADRIRVGMRLEVQHKDHPTAVWVAKVGDDLFHV